ncbi:MAG: integrase [Ruminococcaceae bacterium]|nr:integrase [Oscillospiraceae bacterium]
MKRITDKIIADYKRHLINEEKSPATLEKYFRDLREFCLWIPDACLTKDTVLKYKEKIISEYSCASVNSIISSLNSFFSFNGWYDLKIKTVKVQRQMFSTSEKELTKSEYERLLSVAEHSKNKRIYFVMQTICSTGIRVSELKYITVSSIESKRAEIRCKGKRRTVFLPNQLCVILKRYLKEQKITSGSVFVTKNGKALDRSNIWSEMKKLCKKANVSEKKVFPHNLRHLFARTYYTIQKDIVRLADILGHSSVNTTRIYTVESGEIHRKQIQKLGLLRC